MLSLHHQSLSLLLATSLTATFAFGSLALAQDRPPPEEMRNRARQIRLEMQEMREQGNREGMERLEMELMELKKMASDRGPRENRGEPNPAVREIREMNREMAKLREQGRLDAARDLQHEIERRQEALQAEQHKPMPPEEMERRLHHLRIAIENLHAAGIHEVAERLEQEAKRRMEAMEARMQAEPPMARIGREMERVHRQLDELRAQLDELRRHVEELHRDRR